MDTYLGRPVFPFRINHAKAWSGSIVYDADLRQVGGGAAVPMGMRQHAAQRRDLDVVAGSLREIEEWFSTVRGQARGWWLPLHSQSMRVLSAQTAQSFLAQGTALADRWGQNPCVYLALTDAAGNQHLRHVESVMQSGSHSLVTLDPEEGDLAAPPVSASPLLYVRMASDSLEDIQRMNYDTFTFSFTVLELPDEYATLDDPETPVFLYQIGYVLGARSNWTRWTSWGMQVQGTDGTQWIPAPIEHGDISNDAEGDESSLRCLPWDDCPLADLFPRAEGLPLHVKIYRALWDWGTLRETGTRVLLFDGEVRKPEDADWELKASLQSGVDLFARQVPVKERSRTCRHRFCDVGCKLLRADFNVSATVLNTVNGSLYYLNVQASQAVADGWLDFGIVVSDDYHTGTPSKRWEFRAIQGVTALGANQYRIQIRTPFRWLHAGDSCHLYHGCALTTEACAGHTTAAGVAVPTNVINFDAEALAPLKNPQTQVSTTASAAKK